MIYEKHSKGHGSTKFIQVQTVKITMFGQDIISPWYSSSHLNVQWFNHCGSSYSARSKHSPSQNSFDTHLIKSYHSLQFWDCQRGGRLHLLMTLNRGSAFSGSIILSLRNTVIWDLMNGSGKMIMDDDDYNDDEDKDNDNDDGERS